jgi:hypothetical protein
LPPGTEPGPPRWGFAVEPAPAGRPAALARLAPLGIAWRYDPLLGQWERLPLDPAAPAPEPPLLASNVLVLEPAADPAAPWAGRGRLTLLRDGRALAGSWTHAPGMARLGFLDASGLALALKPGTTWLALLPPGSAPALDGAAP